MSRPKIRPTKQKKKQEAIDRINQIVLHWENQYSGHPHIQPIIDEIGVIVAEAERRRASINRKEIKRAFNLANTLPYRLQLYDNRRFVTERRDQAKRELGTVIGLEAVLDQLENILNETEALIDKYDIEAVAGGFREFMKVKDQNRKLLADGEDTILLVSR